MNKLTRPTRSFLYSWGLGVLLMFAWRIEGGAMGDLAAPFYNEGAVQTVHLEIEPADLARLERALPQRISVPGTFRWKDFTISHVGIRYKGNSSSDPNARHKRSFLVSFSEFQKSQRFIGLRHVALDNAIQFGSLFSEPLITGILRAHGVKASRCNYARVYLNQKYIGMYVNVERIDRSYLKANFGSDSGALFKVDEGGPGADLRDIGADPALYEESLELHAGEKTAAYGALLKFIHTVNDPNCTEAQLRSALEVDAFLTTTAVLLFAGAFDQYTGWSPHNYYLYQNPPGERWSYLPWDLDVGFADHAFGRIPVLDGWNAAWPAPVPNRPLMERVLSNTNLLKVYREKALTILESSFRPEILIPKLRVLYGRIEADLKRDPYPPRRITVPADTSYEDILTSMEAFIRKRYSLARAQLAEPGPRPQVKPRDEGPRPGPPSADAPTELRAVKVTSTSVELAWVDHCSREVAMVVQRCTGENSLQFANVIGQPGQNITTAIDRDIRPGQTYRYRVYAVFPTPEGPGGTGISNVITVRVPPI